MTSDGQPRVRLEDYRPPAFLVDRVDLDVRLEPEQTRVRSRLLIRQNPARPDVSTLVLDGEDLKLAAILLDRIPLPRSDYVVTDRALTIADAPDYPFELEITTIVDPSANTRLMGLYRSNGVYCTQCEAEGFRRITYFPDRPDVLSVFTTRVEARKSDAPILLANGNPVAAGEVPGSDRHFAVWHDPFPKPSYLFALVGGDLGHVADRFTTASGRDVRLGIYVERGKEDRCGYAMEALKRAMRWDEEAFGREYDLDVFNIVAVSDFNMGAMENKGLNVFNDKYILASPETATDVDYANIEAIIAHEYFHNWTGNRITCRDWFQLCLKEGLTVFRDQEFTSDMRSRPVKRISDVRLLRAHQFVEDAGPLAHPVRPNTYNEINNFYTATVYEKGAEVIRMLKVLLGEQGFRAGMNLYFTRHDGDAATIEDFLACFADATGRSLDHFKRWYFQAGTPQLTASGSYDASARRYTLTLEQETPPTPDQENKTPQHIPVTFALVGPDGAEIIPRTDDPALSRPDMIELTEQRRTIVFEDVDARPVPSLLRGFSAPVKLTTDLTDSELLFLSGADGDPFNRWQAMQTVATRILVNAQEAIRADRTPRLEDGLVEAMSRCLTDPALDMAFQAQLLALPSELDITREVGRNVDPDAIHAADSWLRRSLAEQMAEVLDDIYRHHSVNAPYEPDAESAARRALRNAALMFLTAIPGRAGLERALAHYRDADNMTDRIGGLAALTRIDAPETEEALADFYVSHREDPLVLDKWLTLQATTVRADTLERVRKLMEHSAFSMSNPNRLRALVGAFATGNPTQFNRPDGEGFRLVADVVLDVDRTNPQVAARLLSAFKSWRALEAGRRAKAERELRRVAERDGLSRDVSDIVHRSLG